jgi:hypothetical protein
MNAGTINNEGGTINFAGGEIFLGAGLLTMLSGQMTLGGANITMDTGALEVLSGQIIVGTIGSSTSQLGIKCYGGGIGVSKIGSVDGTKTLEINNVASINGQPYVLPEGGKFMITAVANSYTISIPGFTASGLINLTWVGSGGPQWFSSVLSGSGSAIINVGRPGVIGESIIWSVINY